MTYNSATSTQSVTLSGDTTVTFQPSAALLQMRSSTGAALSGQDSAIWWRPTGTTSWSFAGYPDSSGNVSLPLVQGTYDFEARWFGVYQVKSAIAVGAGTTVTWQTYAATEFLRSSSGAGLSGQDSAMWVRPAGSSGWYFSGYPNGAGQVAQELLASSYDFQARWFGVYQVQSAVAIAANSTVTFQTYAATEFMRSSTGAGLSGQDSAIWVRPAGSSGWYFSGYPNSSGQVAQELLASSYDFQARWFGVYGVQSAVPILSNTTVTWQTYAATEFMRSSSGAGLSGQDSAMWVRPAGSSGWYFSGYPNGAGQVAQELLASSYDFQARWFGVYQVQSAVAIAANSTVTFQTYAATEFMRSSTGAGLSGQDSAIWVRPAGSSGWYFSGYPNSSGQVAQELLASSYDFQARWFGVYGVQSAVPILSNTTVTWQTYAATEFMRSSSGAGLSGQDSAIWVRPAGLVGLVLLGVSERFGSGRAGVVAVELRLPGAVVRRVPGAVGGCDRRQLDRDVPGRSRHAEPLVLDGVGVVRSGQCDLGAAGGHVGLVLLGLSEQLGSSRAAAARRQLRRAVPLARRLSGVVGQRRQRRDHHCSERRGTQHHRAQDLRQQRRLGARPPM